MAPGWFPKRGGAQLLAEPSLVQQYAVMPKALRMAAASMKGHAFISDSDVVKVLAEEVFPLSAAIAREDRLRQVALKRAEEEALRNPRAGQLIAGKGIYMGLYEPKDREGKSIGKKYHTFAMPEDLKDAAGNNLVLTFNNTAIEVGKIRGGYGGHDGLYLANDTALYDVLKDGSYQGQWILPDRPLLHGKDVDGNVIAVPNLLANKDNGAFAGTFKLIDDSPGDYPNWYWSLTENREDRDFFVWYVRLSDCEGDWDLKGRHRLSSRLVRLELAL